MPRGPGWSCSVDLRVETVTSQLRVLRGTLTLKATDLTLRLVSVEGDSGLLGALVHLPCAGLSRDDNRGNTMCHCHTITVPRMMVLSTVGLDLGRATEVRTKS